MSGETLYGLTAIAGLALITLLARAFFMLPEHEIALPDWLRRGLKYAPLAALTAVIAPEVVMAQGALIGTLQDARLPAVLCATGYYFWRRGILGTIVVGMAVYLPLLWAVAQWGGSGAAGAVWLWVAYAGGYTAARAATLGWRIRGQRWMFAMA